MKKYIIIAVLFLIVAAQVEAKKIEGQIITSRDTLKVLLRIPVKFLTGQPNYEKLQQKVIYFDASNKKIKIKPSAAQEFRFQFGSETIRMLSTYNTLGLGSIFSSDPKIFLRLRIDGYLKLFSYYDTKSYGGGTMGGYYSYTKQYDILQKGNQGLMKPSWISFRKDMKSFLSECTIVVNMLQYKEMGSGDVPEIVTLYNKQCGQ